MKDTIKILVMLHSLDELFSPAIARPLNSPRTLNREVEEFIIEEAAKTPGNAKIEIEIQVRAGDGADAGIVASQVHRHFAYRREKANREVKQLIRLGWKSMIIAISFLVIVFFLALYITPRLSDGGLGITLREVLIILGWVALWRPAELLLYDWYIPRKNARLFARLEECGVNIVGGQAG